MNHFAKLLNRLSEEFYGSGPSDELIRIEFKSFNLGGYVFNLELKYFRGESGFGWDKETRMMTAPDDV